MIRFRPAVLFLVLALASVSCRIEDRTPRGSRRDEDAIQHLLALYARRLSARDWPGVRSLFWGEGSYAGTLGPGSPRGFRLAVPIDSALDALARSLDEVPADGYDVRVLRTDLRQEGDLAAAWITVRRRTPIAPSTVALEASASNTVERDWIEHVVLRRIGGEWRILSVAATQWPSRR